MLFYRLDYFLEVMRFGCLDCVHILSDESSRILYSVVSDDLDVSVLRAFIQKYDSSVVENFHHFIVSSAIVCDDGHSLSIKVI